MPRKPLAPPARLARLALLRRCASSSGVFLFFYAEPASMNRRIRSQFSARKLTAQSSVLRVEIGRLGPSNLSILCRLV